MRSPKPLPFLIRDAIVADDPIELARLLVPEDFGFDLSFVDSFGRPLLFIAAGAGSESCLKYLIEQGVPINHRCLEQGGANDTTRRTALNHAAFMGKLSSVEILLEAGASPRLVDHVNDTALHYIVTGSAFVSSTKPGDFDQRLRIVDMLIAKGAQVDHCGNNGETALMRLITGTNDQPLAMVEKLLKAGANPNLLSREGEQLLHYPWVEDELPLLRVLVAYGADPNGRDEKGRPPIMHANCTSAIDELIRLGADPFAIDNEGRNAFHRQLPPLTESDLPALEHLLSLGLDPRQADYGGESSMQIIDRAVSEGNEYAASLRAAIAALDAKTTIREAIARTRTQQLR